MTWETTSRKLYAIMRYAKIKSFAALARVCGHNTRTVHSENVRTDAPPPKELLDTDCEDFVASARALLDQLGIDRASVEKKVLAVETVATASKGWFENASDDEKQQWLDANVNWARNKFGRGLLTAKLHLDEEVWHIHFVALPVVEKRKMRRGAPPRDPAKRAEYDRQKSIADKHWTLSYHDLLGGTKERLSVEQDAYHAAVAHLGLERGETQRDDIEIELGDELKVSALALSRGWRPDGTARPRRSMTPKEGRDAVKRLRREAEIAVAEAETARNKAISENRAAALAHEEADRAAHIATEQLRHAQLERQQTLADAEKVRTERETARRERELLEEAHRSLEGAERNLEVKARETAELNAELEQTLRRKMEEADARDLVAENHMRELDMRDQLLFAKEQKAEHALSAARAAQAEVDRTRHELEVALAQAARARENALLTAAEAAKMRLEAEAERTRVTAALAALASDRRKLDEQRSTHIAQIALLMRAADDSTGLHLRSTEAGVVMNVPAMTNEERETYRRPWSSSLVRFAQELVRLLDELRDRTRQILARERTIAAKEKALAEQEKAMNHDSIERQANQLREYEVAMTALEQRDAALKIREAEAARLLSQANMRLDTALDLRTETDALINKTECWQEAIEVLFKTPEFLTVALDNKVTVVPELAAHMHPADIAILREAPPPWANAAIELQRLLKDQAMRAATRESEAALATEALTNMLRQAQPILLPQQQQIAQEAMDIIGRWARAGQGSSSLVR